MILYQHSIPLSTKPPQMIAILKSATAAIAFLLCCCVPVANADPSSSYIPVEQDDRIFNNMIDSSPIVIESHKLIFFPVPKVADTLWLMLLRRMMGIKEWKSLDLDLFDGLARLSDYSIEQATEMMNSPEYTRATFLRDPKDRFLSTFVDKVMSSDVSIKHSCCPEGNNCLLDYQTMKGFANLIRTCEDKHWIPISSWIDRKFVPKLNFVGHLENAEVDARSLLEKVGAWESFGASGWGEHGNETIFATKDKLSDLTASDVSGSWDLMSKLLTPRIESTLELFYEVDYSIHEFGLPLKKIPFPVEKTSSSLRPNKGRATKSDFKKVHIIMFETDGTVEHTENSSLGYFLATSGKASKKAQIETTTFGVGKSFTGWGDKYKYVREMLNNMRNDTLVVVSDARDVMLNVPDSESAASVVSHFISTYQKMTKNLPDAVVMSAESQCCVSAMSQASPLDYFDPITGKRNVRACASGEDSCPYEGGFNVNAWKTFMSELAYRRTGRYHESVFLNAGVFAGPASNIIRLMDRVDIGQTEDDQAVMSGLLYHDPESLVLDYENELFGVAEWPKGLKEGCVFFKDSEDVLIHSVTKASPLIIHTPGKFYGCLDLLIEKVGGVSQKRYLKSKSS
ncbi:sulfotransferase family [Fragilaria crotonensis]|nr:sulfotransferase family [Fragilaria crotonensis]